MDTLLVQTLSMTPSVSIFGVQRKSVLQPAIRPSWSQHALAHTSFQLAPKPCLISRIDYNPSVISISPNNSTCPSGNLRRKITSPIAKSTFFARWCYWGLSACLSLRYNVLVLLMVEIQGILLLQYTTYQWQWARRFPPAPLSGLVGDLNPFCRPVIHTLCTFSIFLTRFGVYSECPRNKGHKLWQWYS